MSYDIGAFEKNLPDPETIRTAGTTLKSKAASFSSKATSTSTSWAKLQHKGVYSAPGDEVVFSAFGPITTAAEDLVTDIGTVKTATDGFADDVDTIKTKLAGIKADAASFEGEIAGRSRDDWDDDEGLVKKEQNIIHGLNGLYAELQTAQMTCANSINALYGGPTYVMVTQDGAKAGQIAYGYTNEQLDAASNEGNIPWGKPTEWDKPWYKDAWDGVCSFGKGVWSGVTGTLKGLWNMVNVTDMDTFKATWKGMGKLALNVAIVSTPLAQVALRATGHGDVVDRAGKELLAVGKAAIHWDDWKRDPAYAAGETTFDLATILLTAGGGAVAKTGSIAGKIAEVSSAGGKMATVLNATKISALANVTIKGVDLVSLLKIKGITIAADGIKVAGTKIAELPVKISGGIENVNARIAAMGDSMGLGGPRLATAGAHGGPGLASSTGRGLADVADTGGARASVMHLDADAPSRATTGVTGSHPGTGAGGGGRAVPEGEPRFGVRTEDGMPTGKPVTQGIHPGTPESGPAKPAATTTHPETPESGSAKPAATTTHPEVPDSKTGHGTPADAAVSRVDDAGVPHSAQADLGIDGRSGSAVPHGPAQIDDVRGGGATPQGGAEDLTPAGAEGHPRPAVEHTIHVTNADLPKITQPFGTDRVLQPSTAYEVPGRGTYYTNAEGRIHYVETEYGTKGHLNPDLMNPAPDATYVVGDNHVFQTDGSSRTVLAHVDDLFRGDAYRSKHITARVGKEGGIGYEGGHLIAKMFGGGTEDINLVAMLREINRGAGHSYGNLEKGLGRLLELEGGPSVDMRIRPTYSSVNSVPDSIAIFYRLNGGDWIKGGFQNFK
ncbi:DNA/RNA non-specific endonuclease [Tersicoccus sp. MR15.9]|uniref:DNA/RNA non-specific endonuclease n=1 Tax=Tersicoccus mangrovi TaxID=3121635 RepID=UPI002FE5B37C